MGTTARAGSGARADKDDGRVPPFQTIREAVGGSLYTTKGDDGMKKSIGLLIGLAILNLDAGQAFAQRDHQPIARVGQCVNTRIVSIGARLEGDPGWESGMHFDTAAGVGGVDYEVIPALRRSRVGDRVRSCLVSI